MIDENRKKFDEKMALVGVALHRRFTKIELNALADQISDFPIDFVLPVIDEMCELDKFAGVNILSFLKAGVRRRVERYEQSKPAEGFEDSGGWFMHGHYCCLCENYGMIPEAKIVMNTQKTDNSTCMHELMRSCRCNKKKVFRDKSQARHRLIESYEDIFGLQFQFPYNVGVLRSGGEEPVTYYDVYRVYIASFLHHWRKSKCVLTEIDKSISILNNSAMLSPRAGSVRQAVQKAMVKGFK